MWSKTVPSGLEEEFMQENTQQHYSEQPTPMKRDYINYCLKKKKKEIFSPEFFVVQDISNIYSFFSPKVG